MDEQQRQSELAKMANSIPTADRSDPLLKGSKRSKNAACSKFRLSFPAGGGELSIASSQGSTHALAVRVASRLVEHSP